GDLDVAVIAGAEAMYTRRLARKQKAWLDWPQQGADVTPARRIGDTRPGSNDAEMSRGLALPTQVYPVFETALRAAAGETVDEHQRRVSELWARFSAVAATNPNAWLPAARTAEEIRTLSAENRPIGFPYPKLMNAIMDVDQ